jgi:formylglycine-generating enzyme required for sulfatase activity
MKLYNLILIFTLSLSAVYAQNAPPFVTYAGQVASGGQPYNGTGQFKFAFVNADANLTYWSQDGTSSAGSQPTGQVSTTVNGGYYSILLGNTAITGMGTIDPTIFKTHSDVHLRVWFSDGVAPFQEMTPHRPFASVPYALNAGVAAGSINKSMLGTDVLTDLNRTVDKSMLAQEVLNDLNATPSTGSVTKSMLSSEVLTDLNRTQSVVGTSDDAFTEGLRAYLRPKLAGGVWHSRGLSGMPVTLKAPKVDGRFLTYQWYKSGSPISGATGTEYVIPDFNATRDTGDYEIRVSNAFATLKTKAVLQMGIGTGVDGRVGLVSYDSVGLMQDSSTLLINSSGSAVGSGRNNNGEIGQGTSSQYLSPVASLFSDGNRSNGLSAVTAGGGHALYLKTDGTLYGVGSNYNGQLGDGTTTQKKYLTPIPNVGNVAQVSAGVYHTMFVKTDGTLWGMGNNGNGQLGNGSNTQKTTAVQVPGVSNVAQVSGGGYYTMFVKTDGTLWGMGINTRGQLGDGSTTQRNSPVQVPGVSNVAQVSAGSNYSGHTMFVKIDGTLWGMGYNYNGQLGDGSTTQRNSPVQVPGVSNVAQVSAGDRHTMFAKTDGTLWGMGENSSGQLGDGSTTNRTSPVQVSGVSNVAQVFSGATYTVFIKTDGTLWAMGNNDNGQFGNGTTISSTTPVQVGNIIAVEEQPFAPESVSDVVQSERPSSERSTHVVQSAANLEMLWVEPGTFTMGSPVGETGRGTDETEHNVTLTKGFYLGKYEVAQAQYEAVMTGNTNSLSATPSQYSGNPNRPVEKVSWDDAQVFLTRLNAAEQAAGRLPAGWSYVLPTESQWEYACRAGTTTVYSWGNTITSANANYNNTIGQTADVGQYAANPWGFFDMHGNVLEWTADWYGTYPTGNPVIDPLGAASGSDRVVRGGSWSNGGADLRSARRNDDTPGNRSGNLGFRVGFQQQ